MAIVQEMYDSKLWFPVGFCRSPNPAMTEGQVEATSGRTPALLNRPRPHRLPARIVFSDVARGNVENTIARKGSLEPQI